MQRNRRRDLRTLALYVAALVREFRTSLVLLAAAVLFGGVVTWLTPHEGGNPSFIVSLYAAWAVLLNQPLWPPDTWYLAVIDAIYPVLGFVLIGEGLIRFVFLMSSRRRGEKEWMKVMASTYRDHVIVCGLGHVGWRVMQTLLASGTPLVALERDGAGRFVSQARATGAPILVRDIRDDEALAEAGIACARSIVVATDDDMANIEVALDARRLNPRIRIVLRLFDQQIAAKLVSAGMVDEAFSTSALAAPAVATMALAASPAP